MRSESVSSTAAHCEPSEAIILVTGIARNCGHSIRFEIAKLRDAVSAFKKVFWLVIESDSNDGTVTQLECLAKEIDNFRCLALGNLAEKFPLRTERIAYCRNVYLDEISNNLEYSNLDYVVVADLDGVNSLLDSSALLSCWARRDWDVCTANQKGPYYDIWALRHPIWCPTDCWQQVSFLSEFNTVPEDVHHVAVYSKMVQIPDDHPWIEVQSAFGGLAVYRTAAIRSARYNGLRDGGKQICEHVAFHSTIVTLGGRIYINPRLVNSGANEHSFPVLERRKIAFYFALLCRQCLRHAKEFIKRNLLKIGYKRVTRAN